MPLTHFPHTTKHLLRSTHCDLWEISGVARCCRVVGLLPGCCRVLPGCPVPVRTSSQLVWALRLPGCRVAGYCRVLPGTAGLPGRCRVVAGLGCRVAGARAQGGGCSQLRLQPYLTPPTTTFVPLLAIFLCCQRTMSFSCFCHFIFVTHEEVCRLPH